MRQSLYRLTAGISLAALTPLFLILYILVKTTSKGPFIYKQKRAGKNMKPFIIYKIRTMVTNAEKLQKKYAHLNQADGPVFKIYDDPRFTKIGKMLARSGLDELPQLFNIMKGDMSFVGPRPLPLIEAEKIPKKYNARFSMLPGMTSPWVISGSHKLTFTQWMELDIQYAKHNSLMGDLLIIILTIRILFSGLPGKSLKIL